MSQITVPTNYDLAAIAKAAGSTVTSYESGNLVCNCPQDAIDAALAAYDHDAYEAAAKVVTFKAAVQTHMDAVAQSRDYDNIQSAVGYVTSTNAVFGPEGIAFRDWRDDVWTICYSLLADWQAGGPEPTIAGVIAGLPTFPG